MVVPVGAAAPNNPAILLGEPDGMDTFDNANNWSLFDAQCFKSEITGGKFVMTSKGVEGQACWEVSWPKIQDFYTEVTIEMPASCNPKDRFGLIFRAPDNNRGYLYGLSCEGEYSMMKWDGYETSVIVDADTDTVIATGKGLSNRIGVLASSDNFYLYVNGQFIAQGQDSTFITDGKLGFYVRAASNQGFTVSFDDLAIWLLDDAYYPQNPKNLIYRMYPLNRLLQMFQLLPQQLTLMSVAVLEQCILFMALQKKEPPAN